MALRLGVASTFMRFLCWLRRWARYQIVEVANVDVNLPVIVDPDNALISVVADGVSITDTDGTELVRIRAATNDPQSAALFVRRLLSVSSALGT